MLLYVGLLLNIGPGHGLVQLRPAGRARTTRRASGWTSGRRWSRWSRSARWSGRSRSSRPSSSCARPGMSLNRIPLFVWAQVVTSFMIIFAMPAVMLCSTMLATDRMTQVNTHFFNPAEGGDPLLWQHLFWFFAHPEVYIIFLPATGFVSAILPTFCPADDVRLHGAGAVARSPRRSSGSACGSTTCSPRRCRSSARGCSRRRA